MLTKLRLLVSCVLLSVCFGVSAQSFSVDHPGWQPSDDGVEVVEFQGRRAFKFVRGRVILDNMAIQDAEVRFELWPSDERAFFYLQFRGQSEAEYEDVYFRAHKSGLPDAVQYSPVFQRRSAWQLYHGAKGTAPAAFPQSTWVPIRIRFQNRNLSVWVGDSDTPAMQTRLAGASGSGWLALRGFVPRNSNASHAGYATGFTVMPLKTDAEGDFSQPKEAVDEAIITNWRVSPAFDAPQGPITTLPGGLGGNWSTVKAQPDGSLEFLRWRQIPENSRHWAVAAEVSLSATEAQTCAVQFGYSDEITASLNGDTLFYQNSAYRFGSPRQDGVMHDQQVTGFLNLARGQNTLRVIIADGFGGWGLMARLVDCVGVTVG